MNFNANTGPRQSLGRKVKRVSDVNSMGYNPYTPPNPYNTAEYTNQQQFQSEYVNTQQNYDTPKDVGYGFIPPNSYNNMPQPGMNVFGQPIVQDIAMQYGQQLASSGKAMVQEEIKKIVPVTKLKYYFAVDTKYVINKLRLLFFPFTHRDWSIKYEQDNPVQPRYEINAPDLYIPSMAYLTYVLVAGVVLGMQKRFSPEQIGIQASSALAWCLFELAIYSCTLYIANIQTSLKLLDLLAFSGYKFVGIIASILLSIAGATTGYYCGILYTNLALAFYLVRTLRVQVLSDASQKSTNYYENSIPSVGNKRRLYFLLFVAITQPLLSWWLSFHLIGYVSQPTSAS